MQVLLSQLFKQLYLKEKQFKLFTASSEEEMEDLWGELSKFGNLPVGKKQIELKQSLKDWYV